MTEWWTYRLSDFLMFAPRTYARLFELYNADVWPAQWLMLAAGLVATVAWWRHHRLAARFSCVVLALAWAIVGWAFHWQRFEPINWAAAYVALACLAQALLLALAAAAVPRWQSRGQPARGIGLTMLALALLLPALAAALGRPWLQSQVFGFAPDPTTLATLGVLTLTAPADRGRIRRVLEGTLWIVPLLWCGVGGAMSWTLEAPDAALLPLAGGLAVWAARRGRAPADHSVGTKIHISR